MRRLGGLDLALMESLFDHHPDAPFFVKDADLRYVAANRAMLDLVGLKERADLLGRTSADLFAAAASRRYEALDRQVLKTARTLRDRLELTAGRGGRAAWLLFIRAPVLDPDGTARGVVATSRRLAAPDARHPAYERLAGVVGRMRAEFRSPLGLAALADEAGMSLSQLERGFRRLFGMSPRDYLNKVRIDHAVELLAGRQSIARIALACGYADHSAFTRRFGETVGMAPRAYRARLAAG